jgi:hypothetical protein
MFGIELEGFPSDEEMKKWPKKAKKLAVENIKLRVLRDVIRIEPKIHLIRFLGDYDYNQIKEKIDTLTVVDTEDKLFKTIAFGNFKGVNLRISLYPRDHELFRSMISFNFKSYDHLFKLKKLFPGLMPSKVEYTLDLKCQNPTSTRNLFNLLKRYTYIPKKSVTQLFYSDLTNCTYYIGNKKKKQYLYYPDLESDEKLRGDFKFKIYERGKKLIIPKKKKGWHRNSLDTVRIEYTAKYSDLNKKGFYFIDDFLEDCKFHKTMMNSFRLRNFKESSKQLPKEWIDYRAKDEDGFINSFQEEYNQSKVKNTYQYITEPEGFDDFKFSISAAMRKFDRQWKSNYNNFSNSE